MEVKKDNYTQGYYNPSRTLEPRKGFLHKHNTLGETKIKYAGYKVMTG